MNKNRIIVIMTAILIAVTIYYFAGGHREADNKTVGKTIAVERGDLVLAISASGVIEPNFKVEVKSKASGKILEFPFEPGDKVKAGQTLLKLDPRTERRSLAQREADLSRALADLQFAKAELMERESKLKRAKALSRKNLVSKEALESAEAATTKARARISEVNAAIRKARLVVEDAKERLEDTVIASPIDGVIIEKSVERGQIISSGITSFSGGTKLCVVADLSRIFVMTLVDETDIGKVSVGQKTKLTVDAYADKTFKGKVTRVYPMGESRDNITVFRVKVEAFGDDLYLLKPKMTANVDMILKVRKNILIAPDSAIKIDKNDEQKGYVYVPEGSGLIKREVALGLSNGFETEISEGVKEGDKILLRPEKKNDSGS